MYSVKSSEDRMSSDTTAPTKSFFVRYLGCNTYKCRSKPKGIKALQAPLLELYSTARRKGEDHRSVHPLALTQRLDVSHYGLVVAETLDDPETRDAVTVVTRVITPATNIVLWAALRFNSRIAKRKSIGAAFVPIACCSDDVVDRSWYVRLATKRRFLVGLAHPPLFACLLRRVAAPKTWECHAFLCASAEDALLVCSTLGEARNSVVVVDRPLLGYHTGPVEVESSADFSDGALTSTSSFHKNPYLFSNRSSNNSHSARDTSSVPSGRYQCRSPQKGRLFTKRQARTDTESKSSTSDERHRRVRRRSHVNKNLARKYRSSDTNERHFHVGTKSADSYGSDRSQEVRTSSRTTRQPKASLYNIKSDNWTVNSSIQTDETKSWDSSVGQTQTNDTGYFSNKSKSLSRIDEVITNSIYVKPDYYDKNNNDGSIKKKQTYYFGDNLNRPISRSYKENSTNTESSTGTKTYTYFLSESKNSTEKPPWLREIKPELNSSSLWKSRTVVIKNSCSTPENLSDSSVSGYHSHTYSPTRDTATMTDNMQCSSDLDCCSCDMISVCSECSQCCTRKVRRYPDQMELSETMDLSSESEHTSVKQWKKAREPVVCSTYSYIGGVRTPNENFKPKSVSREIQTQAEVHTRYPSRNGIATRSSQCETPSSTKASSSVQTIHGNGTNKVVIDVQYPSKTNSMPTGVIGFNKHGNVRDWASLSPGSEISHAPGSGTFPVTRSPRPQKVIRWSSMERSPGFFTSLKKLSISSFTKAKRKTGKLFSNVRHRMSHKKKKSSTGSEDSAYDTAEVCLSPDGSQKPKPKKKRRRLSWSFHDLRVAFPSMKTSTNSKEIIYVNNHRAGQRRHRRRRNKFGSSETSDSGVDEYHSDYSSTYNSHRKTDSELEQFATEVSRVNVNHGMSKDSFRRWSQTNLHGELGYIP